MGSFLLKEGNKIDADKWFKKVAPKNGILKLYWHPSGDLESLPQFNNCGHGLRYLWAYKDGKRADGFSRSWHYNQHRCDYVDTPTGHRFLNTNNGAPRFLANWKNNTMVGSQFFYHSNGLPYLERHNVETKWGVQLVLRNSWTPDGIQEVIDGNGIIEVCTPIEVKLFTISDEEGLLKLDGDMLLKESKFLSLWKLDIMDNDTLYMKKDISAGECLEAMHEHYITDYFTSVYLPKIEQYNKFKNVPGKGFVKVVDDKTEEHFEKVWEKGMPHLAEGTHLEFQQYYGLFDFPNRFVRYRAEYKDGWKIKESWYEPIEQSQLGEIFTSQTIREIEYDITKLKCPLKKDNWIRKDLWKENLHPSLKVY